MGQESRDHIIQNCHLAINTQPRVGMAVGQGISIPVGTSPYIGENFPSPMGKGIGTKKKSPSGDEDGDWAKIYPVRIPAFLLGDISPSPSPFPIPSWGKIVILIPIY